MSSSAARLPAPEGPGSVSGAPHLPEGFTASSPLDAQVLVPHPAGNTHKGAL
jgi:hypothetical protein